LLQVWARGTVEPAERNPRTGREKTGRGSTERDSLCISLQFPRSPKHSFKSFVSSESIHSNRIVGESAVCRHRGDRSGVIEFRENRSAWSDLDAPSMISTNARIRSECVMISVYYQRVIEMRLKIL
jgi:hypothetical protein